MRRGTVWLILALCCLAVAVWAADHLLTVSASADPATVPYRGSTQLRAEAIDSLGYSVAAWQWTDNDAGGRFSPSANVQSPIYTPPRIHGRGWKNVDGIAATLTVTATSAADDGLRASANLNVFALGRYYEGLSVGAGEIAKQANGKGE